MSEKPKQKNDIDNKDKEDDNKSITELIEGRIKNNSKIYKKQRKTLNINI